MMPTDKRSVSEIVPRKDTSLFHLRLRLSLHDDLAPAEGLAGYTDVVAAGCKCTAYYTSGISDPNLALYLVPGCTAKVSTHMVLLDKNGSPATSMGTGAATTEGLYSLIAPWDDVKANCVVDNYFVVLCSVDIDRTPPAALSSLEEEEEELPELGRELAVMSINKELTDVSFNVEGESFDAHRLVFAARSPVSMARWLKARWRRSPSRKWGRPPSDLCYITCTMVHCPVLTRRMFLPPLRNTSICLRPLIGTG
jgi:speckle-type POZ protein